MPDTGQRAEAAQRQPSVCALPVHLSVQAEEAGTQGNLKRELMGRA